LATHVADPLWAPQLKDARMGFEQSKAMLTQKTLWMDLTFA